MINPNKIKRLILMRKRTVLFALLIFSLTMASITTIPHVTGQENIDNENLKEIELSLSLEKKEENLLFSGTLTHSENELDLIGHEITILEVGFNENQVMGQTTTRDNGYFEISLEPPKEGGFYRFMSTVSPEGYSKTDSNSVFYNSLDFTRTALVSVALVIIFLAAVGFFLNKKIEESDTVIKFIFGALIGWTIFQIIGLLGPIIGGAIIGFFIYQKFEGIKGKLSLGLSGALGGLAAYLVMEVIMLSTMSEIISEVNIFTGFTILQGDFLSAYLFNTLQLGIMYTLFTLLGVLLGGSIVGILNKRENLKEE